MSIKTVEEFECMRTVGRVVRRVIDAMRQHVRPGVTTAELDDVGSRVMREHGAEPSLMMPGIITSLVFRE